MYITNQQQLKKQKKKLSLLFTLILFFVVTGLQILFLLVKYIDYNNKEFGRLHWEWSPKVSMMVNMFSWKNFIPPMSNFPWAGRWWRLKWWNIIQYNHVNNTIEFSSLNDDESTQEIIKQISQKWKDREWSILYNNIKILFVKEKISQSSDWIFLIPSQATAWGIIGDIVLFILFFGICSFGFYRVIYYFVSKLFKPIEENIQDMEQFVFNAGHELKTPLSVIKSSLQLASLKKQYKQWIKESIDEIDKMNALIESLVNLSTISDAAKKEKIKISEEIISAIKNYTQAIDQKKITIDFKKEEEIVVDAKRSYVAMLIGNIVSNAIKYNKKWWTITILLKAKELIIIDTGIWIPEKNISKIYNRFFQWEMSRNQEWFGIGLSLVKKIVDAYGWKITLTSKEWQGTTAIIHFS